MSVTAYPAAPAYTGMPPQTWQPPAPQVLRDVAMVIIGYRADEAALRSFLPPGLEPHESRLVQMNMYECPDPAQTSGFGPFSLTYLTAEVAGHDSYAAEGTLAIPGRFFMAYWNSSDRMRRYAREKAGIPAVPGSCRWERSGDRLTSTLDVDGSPAIRAELRVGDTSVGKLGGHLNYYTHRQFPALDGGRAAISELVELPIPFVAELFEANVESVKFTFPQGSPFARLAPLEPLDVGGVLYGKTTFSYPLGRCIENYLPTNGSP